CHPRYPSGRDRDRRRADAWQSRFRGRAGGRARRRPGAAWPQRRDRAHRHADGAGRPRHIASRRAALAANSACGDPSVRRCDRPAHRRRADAPGGGMNAITQIVVAALPHPDPAVLAEAADAPETPAEHDRLAAEIAALSAIEYRAPPAAAEPGKSLRLAAWNAERLKYGPASAALLDEMGADVVLLSEADLGMARSGNRH